MNNSMPNYENEANMIAMAPVYGGGSVNSACKIIFYFLIFNYN